MFVQQSSFFFDGRNIFKQCQGTFDQCLNLGNRLGALDLRSGIVDDSPDSLLVGVAVKGQTVFVAVQFGKCVLFGIVQCLFLQFPDFSFPVFQFGQIRNQRFRFAA